MSTQTILPIDRNSVFELSTSKNEPEWMTNLRLQALELAGQLELPKLEKTSLKRWQLDAIGSLEAAGNPKAIDVLPDNTKLYVGEETADPLVYMNNSGGVFARISEELSAQGVIFTDLATAVKEHSDLVQKYFAQAVKPDEHRLAALHTAAWNAGVFLYVPKNVEISIPLQALFITENSTNAFVPHVLIVAEDNSSVIYTDTMVSDGGDGPLVSNAVVEVFVKPGAKVQFSSVHQLGEEVVDISYRRAVVEKDGSIDWIIGEMNNGNGISDTTSLLKGDGSESDAKVICVGTSDQKLNLTTRARHFGRSSRSDMITRAVMRDSATAIINGITKIEKGATGAHGEQTERVMMLSPKARGDANPMLLIDEDDVTAGHAASVGQVNPEDVYYLMSRGISREQAERLIIYGFLAPVVSEIPLENLEKRLQRMVERKLGQ
ncbi:Fe-S cluster assembly protein SufD [Paenibacillus senegalensis]|uniref:Fe-S cluster assembly protein SufD n=1 Tax=Paenibacillus senegalensis TaxID=1465766 RepID=UPI0002888F3E|nr:Fe-S cluster assembly protein SufD [Paenibacillus senegalensis]